MNKRLLYVLGFLYLGMTQSIQAIANTIEEAEQGVIVAPSPLVDVQTTAAYSRLSSLAYKPSQSLYPVRIDSINDFVIKPLLHGYEYPLAAGEYVVEVRPDFSLIRDLQPFMNTKFVAKRIQISLSGNRRYAIGARIDAANPTDWQVQLFDIQPALPTE